jgi:hypothetical protein
MDDAITKMAIASPMTNMIILSIKLLLENAGIMLLLYKN